MRREFKGISELVTGELKREGLRCRQTLQNLGATRNGDGFLTVAHNDSIGELLRRYPVASSVPQIQSTALPLR